MSNHLESILDAQQLSAPVAAHYDAVVIGAGVAGLSFSLRLPSLFRIALLTKASLGESNTRYAQGGLSAAIGPDDSPGLHEEDTLAAGAGLCDPSAVRALVDGAPDAVAWLLSIGANFDRDKVTGELELGREAAHSRHRVLHAGGDATGSEIERALVAAVRSRPNVDIFEHAFGIDLIVEQGTCAGLICHLPGHNGIVRLEAPLVVLAAGGAGQIWSVTSNPEGATADGLAMALRAGVAVADLEFVQFHPTVLAVPGTDAFLVTEAVRGEGAHLLDSNGHRFMTTMHPLAELAPRDIVARGIQSAMASTETEQVYLDLRHLNGPAMHQRFPTISRELRKRGLDLASDLIPVAPAAHYVIGGVAAGVDGRTSVPGLLALGEAACSGVHGANRLASNSLLEGLVFGNEAAQLVAKIQPPGKQSSADRLARRAGEPPGAKGVMDAARADIDELVRVLQSTMGRDVAVVRSEQGLTAARSKVDQVAANLASIDGADRRFWEARNLALAAEAVITAALWRRESRGAHYRSDYPSTDSDLDGRHSLCLGGDLDCWQFGALANVIADDVQVASGSAG